MPAWSLECYLYVSLSSISLSLPGNRWWTWVACFIIYPIPMSDIKRIRQAPFNPPYPKEMYPWLSYLPDWEAVPIRVQYGVYTVRHTDCWSNLLPCRREVSCFLLTGHWPRDFQIIVHCRTYLPYCCPLEPIANCTPSPRKEPAKTCPHCLHSFRSVALHYLWDYTSCSFVHSIALELKHMVSLTGNTGMVVLLGIEGWNEDALHTLIQNR